MAKCKLMTGELIWLILNRRMPFYAYEVVSVLSSDLTETKLSAMSANIKPKKCQRKYFPVNCRQIFKIQKLPQ